VWFRGKNECSPLFLSWGPFASNLSASLAGFLVRGMAENRTIHGGGTVRAENSKTSVISLHKR
jgi:hypothetical protein